MVQTEVVNKSAEQIRNNRQIRNQENYEAEVKQSDLLEQVNTIIVFVMLCNNFCIDNVLQKVKH